MYRSLQVLLVEAAMQNLLLHHGKNYYPFVPEYFKASANHVLSGILPKWSHSPFSSAHSSPMMNLKDRWSQMWKINKWFSSKAGICLVYWNDKFYSIHFISFPCSTQSWSQVSSSYHNSCKESSRGRHPVTVFVKDMSSRCHLVLFHLISFWIYWIHLRFWYEKRS